MLGNGWLWDWRCTLGRMEFPSQGTSETKSLREPSNIRVSYECDMQVNTSFSELTLVGSCAEERR
jgi:hypothetical protein